MLPNWKRRLIPKWRDSNITSKLAESMPINKKESVNYDFTNTELQSYVSKIVEDWRENKSIGGAANLLSFGYLDNLHPLIIEPAEYVIESKQYVPDHLINLAYRISGSNRDLFDHRGCLVQQQKFYNDAALLKKKIITNPQDAIALVDLARIYSSLGQNKKAEKAILTAVHLYPEHRYILRSATRFFIHNNDATQSLYFLNKSERTKVDPWVMAAQISVSLLLQKPQKLIKKAKEIINSQSYSPIHTSELCGLLATIQIIDGNNKDARRYFNKALIAPNDNTVAQAIWVSQYYKMQISTKSEWFSDPLSSEANFYNYDLLGDFERALDAALEWQNDEPFSINPAIAATYMASIIDKHGDAEKYARNALLMHPDDVNLRNNLVFALAAQNMLDDAENMLRIVIKYEQQHGKLSPQSIANMGMIAFRSSQLVEGEQMYRTAIDLYDKENDVYRKAIAMAYLAKEATLAKAPNAENFLKEALGFVKIASSRPAERILSSIAGVVVSERTTSLIKPVNWKYDKERNIIFLPKTKPFRE